MPVKKLEKPTKRARKNFPESVPVKHKKMPVKKKQNYARETIQNPLVNTQFQPVKTHLFPVKKFKILLKSTREKHKVGVKKINIWPKSGRENSFSACKKIEKTGKKTFHGHYFSTGKKKTLPKHGIL